MIERDDRNALPRWPNWLGLVVEDLETQRRFYGDLLGLEEVGAGEDWVQFDMGAGNLFEILRRNDQPQYERTRFQPGFAVHDIHAARARLREHGVEAISPVEGGPDSGGTWCYFRDPEGNVFEVSQRLASPDRPAATGSILLDDPVRPDDP